MTFLLPRRWRRNKPLPRTRPGQRIYAIGDIHGRADLLSTMMALIAVDAKGSKAQDHVLIFLGDYIDRGPASRQVIETLSGPPPDDFTSHCLMGNHEYQMQQVIAGGGSFDAWLDNGGLQAMESYGCRYQGDPGRARRDLLAKIPDHHLKFLRSLRSSRQEGDYIFVHAGLRPGVAIEGQSDSDLMTIRATFLNSTEDFGKFVIHGHSIRPEPDIRRNRIGIDTGAWRTGVLTCLVLEGDEKRFLAT